MVAYVTSTAMPMMNASMMTPVIANVISRFQAVLKPAWGQLKMNTKVPMKVMRTVMMVLLGEDVLGFFSILQPVFPALRNFSKKVVPLQLYLYTLSFLLLLL